MNILEFYQTSEKYIKPVLRGVRDVHCWAERRVEDVDDIRIIGAFITFFGYATGSWYLFSTYGLKGLLPLAIVAGTNFQSYRRRRERERRIREIGEP